MSSLLQAAADLAGCLPALSPSACPLTPACLPALPCAWHWPSHALDFPITERAHLPQASSPPDGADQLSLDTAAQGAVLLLLMKCLLGRWCFTSLWLCVVRRWLISESSCCPVPAWTLLVSWSSLVVSVPGWQGGDHNLSLQNLSFAVCL